jgi:ribose/xylose/arabinose/galactoside ABC-type transport system permease subunit
MALVLVVFEVMRPSFLTWSNLYGVLLQAAPLTVLACGLAVVMAMKGIDMSAAATADMAAYVAAILVLNNTPLPVVIAVVILLGAGSGAVNGVLSGYLGVPALVASLGLQLILVSIVAVISHSKMLMYATHATPGFMSIGSKTVAGIPIVVLVAALCVALLWAMTRRTSYGRYVDAIDANHQAARLSAVPVRRTFMLGFVICGVAGALAGMLFLTRTGIAMPQSLSMYLLESLTAVYLGSMASGQLRIRVLWTVVGVVFVSLLSNGLTLLGYAAPVRYGLNGLLIIFALAVGVLRRPRA